MLSVLNMRLWLRQVYSEVPATYATLLIGLMAVGTEARNNMASGQLQSTAANGHSTQFATGDGATSAIDIAESASYLLDLYDTCMSVLVTSGIASPTDAQLYAEMMHRLVRPQVVRYDYTEMRKEGA